MIDVTSSYIEEIATSIFDFYKVLLNGSLERNESNIIEEFFLVKISMNCETFGLQTKKRVTVCFFSNTSLPVVQ